jgi:hypothetical protein
MKGYRFYAEYSDKTEKNKTRLEGEHDGNVVAIMLDKDGRPISHMREHGIVYECIAAVHHHKNSGVAGTFVGREYKQNKLKRISEEKAREIHPRLFKWIEEAKELEKAYAKR